MRSEEADQLLGRLLNGKLRLTEAKPVDWRAFPAVEQGLLWRILCSSLEMGRPLIPDEFVIHVARTFDWVTPEVIARVEGELLRLRKTGAAA